MSGARRDRRAGRGRGFTLIELIITVAIIGILAAMAIVGYRRYLHVAQSSEAKSMIAMIRGGQENYKSEMMQYLSPSTTMTDYYPLDPNTKQAKGKDFAKNWIQPGDTRFTNATTGWALLNVAPAEPVRFGYACMAGVGGQLTTPTDMTNPPSMPTVPAGVPWYVIQAKNNHNPSQATPRFAVFANASTSSEIFSENEQD